MSHRPRQVPRGQPQALGATAGSGSQPYEVTALGRGNVVMGRPLTPAVDAATEFHRLYDAEIVGLVRSATLILGSRQAAQDVVHDAFVAVWRRWGTIDE